MNTEGVTERRYDLIRLVQNLASTNHKDSIDIETALFDDLNFDGLDVITLAMDVEEEFEVVFTDAQIESWKTISCIEQAISEQKGK